MEKTVDIYVRETMALIAPATIKKELPMTPAVNASVVEGRESVKNILAGKDKRMLLVVGPCSIHDTKAALEYAQKLAVLKERFRKRLYIIMRVYFEKPRTTIGWKGLINDPFLDKTYDIYSGLRMARKLLVQINEMNLSTATEMLDPIIPQYIAGLISWAAIGARTTESQTHREMASGLSMPVGFKNSTTGDLQVAIDAMLSAKHQHNFLGIDEEGKSALVKTLGNPYGHIILRGGHQKPNFDPESVKKAEDALRKAGLAPYIMVDCSHANSSKKQERQEIVWKSVIEQRLNGNQNLMGMMLESNLFAGNQKIGPLSTLQYGVSVTDACVSWATTERLLNYAYEKLAVVIDD